jgi:hypothetical protein
MDQTFEAERPATACSYDGRLSRDAVHRIDIILRRYGQTGPYYRVAYAGQTLIESTKEPLFGLPCPGSAGSCGALGNVGQRTVPTHDRARH